MIIRVFSLFSVTLLISACSSPKGPEKHIITVYVQGEVPNPGKYELEDGSGAIRAIVEAGGFTYCSRKSYTVTNIDRICKLDAIKVLEGEQNDFILQDGCVVQVWPDCWAIDPVGSSTNDLFKRMINYTK